MLWIGTASAILAAILGLILVNQEDYAGKGVTIHQWSGLTTMLLAILTVVGPALRAHFGLPYITDSDRCGC